MTNPNSYLLAIESAIAGGSLALFSSENLISSRCGDGSVSRAEDLLPNIISMLAEAGISKDDLSRVAVSLGPGSYTGLRIGIATAMGLTRGLSVEYVGVPLFKAIGAGALDSLIAVPMGKTDICFADSRNPGSSRVVTREAFFEVALDITCSRILVHPALVETLDGIVDESRHVEVLDPNLAIYVGRTALMLPPSERLDPIYVQNPRLG